MTPKIWNLQLFAGPGGANEVVNATIGYVNANTGQVDPFAAPNDLSAQNKTFYDTVLLTNAREKHYFAQFGKKQALPANNGQTVEWRKFNTLPKAMEPLTEGVTPTGRKMGQTVLTQSIAQHGDYVELTDKIQMHAIDNVVVAATEELGAAAGNTQDALVRDELLTGMNVLYCDKVASGGTITKINHRWELTAECKLTPRMVNRARTILAKGNAPTIGGDYVALIPSSVLEDLRQSAEWIEAHKYAAPEEIFNGEAGKLHGVRFIETNTVRTFAPAPLNGNTRYLTVYEYSSIASDSSTTVGKTTAYRITLSDTITEGALKALLGRRVLLEQSGATKGQMEIVGVNTTSKYLYVNEAPPAAPAQGNYLIPGEGGAETYAGGEQVATYACMFFGQDAFAVIDPAGGSMQTIVKPLGSAGTSDPLNQRSTVGYKFETASKILYPERLLRVECGSSYSAIDEDNE